VPSVGRRVGTKIPTAYFNRILNTIRNCIHGNLYEPMTMHVFVFALGNDASLCSIPLL
jgi:hypothetical protein